MNMTNSEIVREYNEAKSKSKQIRILADQNECTPAEIRDILEAEGIILKGVKKAKPALLPEVHKPGITLKDAVELISFEICALNDEEQRIKTKKSDLAKLLMQLTVEIG